MNKKGNFQDVLFIMAILFATLVALVILYYIWGQVSPELTASIDSALPAGETSFNVTALNANIGTGILMFNPLVAFFLVGLIVFVVIAAFQIGSHPVFFFLSIFILAIFILVAVVFSNTYQSIIETDELAASSAEFTVSNLIMEYLPYIMLIITILVMIVLFAKPWQWGGGSI